jgi:hypothetical protein
MAVDVVLRDERVPGREESTLRLVGIPQSITLRDLIRTRVREEVASFNAGPREHFRGLVQPTDSDETAGGYRLRRTRALRWEEQADAAEKAFGRNGFFVLVGDRQVEDLDDELDLAPETEIRFVKLVALVGG